MRFLLLFLLLLHLLISLTQSSALWTFPPDVPGDIDKLLAEIKEHVLRNQIRVTEWFEDFDPLRSGKIPVDRFRQVRSLVPNEPDCLSMEFVHVWVVAGCMQVGRFFAHGYLHCVHGLKWVLHFHTGVEFTGIAPSLHLPICCS